MTDSALTTTRPGSIYACMEAFDNAQRIAKSLASSTLVPPQFQGQQGYANCLVALEIAGRMNLSPLQVMQNLHIIHGRPEWSGKFIIALINGCGQFERAQFRVTGKGDDLACQCVAKEISSGAELEGPMVTMAMAKAEGWATKSGNKWRTMPELMISYRAATFWARLYIPELLVGISYSQEEVMDIEPITVEDALQPEPTSAPEPADELF